MWRITRTTAGLDQRVTPYSIRHGLAREMRKWRVPTEQISLFLGHLPDGSSATTSIYAPYEPGFLSDAIAAIESVMMEVRKHLKHANIDQPNIDPSTITEAARKSHPRAVGETKRQEVRFLILSGVPHKEVVRLSGVSSCTVSGIRQELRASTPLYRNSESDICVPNACPTSENEHDLGEELFQAFEKIGGPGGTRTPDNTVMSGAF